MEIFHKKLYTKHLLTKDMLQSYHKYRIDRIHNLNRVQYNHHLQCQEFYFTKLHVFQIINNFNELEPHGFLIGFLYQKTLVTIIHRLNKYQYYCTKKRQINLMNCYIKTEHPLDLPFLIYIFLFYFVQQYLSCMSVQNFFFSVT